MRGRIALPKSFARKSKRGLCVSRSFWSASQISNQAGESNVFDERVHRARQRECHRISHLCRAHHAIAWPFALDLAPDFRISCGWINVDHAHFAVAQLFAHATREAFERKLAHAVRAPVWERGFCRDGKN